MPEASYNHLDTQTGATLNWSVDDRIRYNWNDWWVPYPAGDQAVGRIVAAMKRPKVTRPRGIVLEAPAGNGKTSVLKKVSQMIPAQSLPDVEVKPTLYVMTPASAGDGRIVGAILYALGYTNDWDKGSADLRLRRTMNALQACKVDLLMFDEFHNLLDGGKKTFESLRRLKNISNDLGRPIVIAGTEKTSNVLKYDPQFTTRFDRVRLPLWEYNKALATMIYGVQSKLSLREDSRLYTDDKLRLIFDLSKFIDSDRRKRPGILDNMVRLVKTASEAVLLSGREAIEAEDLRRAAEEHAWGE